MSTDRYFPLQRLAFSFALILLFFTRATLAAQNSAQIPAQTTAPPSSLPAAVATMAAHPKIVTPLWVAQLDAVLKGASASEIAAELPRLVALSEDPDPTSRGNALLLLYALVSRTAPAQHTMDTTAAGQLVSYLPRLVARLTDPATPVRSMTFVLLQSFLFLRPAPPALLHLTLDLLKDPGSTVQPPDTTQKTPSGRAPAIGPQLLWIILPAGATFARDPSTGVTEGRDSAEVQTAIINFIQRPDHTPESRAETTRALALAQPQNPAVNAALLPWLTSSDVLTQRSLLENLNRLTLAPEDYTRARVVVGNLAGDPQTPAGLRRTAAALLPCWTNDRHHAVLCPPPSGVINVTP